MSPEDPSTDVATDTNGDTGGNTNAATDTRDRSLDVAKGIAIVAIVVSHVLRGLADPDTLPRQSTGFLEVDNAMYSVHIAVFALVAGVFVRPGVDKRGAGDYLRPRLTLFAWVYVVWTLVLAGSKQVESVVLGHGIDPGAVGQAFATAYGPLWWLGFIAMATVIAVVVRPWRSRPRVVVSTVAVAAVSLAAWGWTGPWLFEEGVALLLFFWAGVLAGRVAIARLTRSRWTPWVAVGGAAVGAFLLVASDPMPPTSWIFERNIPDLVLGVVTSSALVAGVLALSGLLSRTLLVRPLGFLGTRSLEIFLAHILATTWTHQVLQGFGIDNLAVEIVLGTLAGVGGPLALWWVGRRIGFPWLFRSPWH